MHVLAIGHLTGKDIAAHLEAEGRAVASLRAVEVPAETQGRAVASLRADFPRNGGDDA